MAISLHTTVNKSRAAMNILLLVIFLSSNISLIWASYSIVRMLSPTPDLVRIIKDDNAIHITQIQTDATISLYLGNSITLEPKIPLYNTMAMKYYILNKDIIVPALECRLWYLIVLPAEGAFIHQTDVKGWLELTKFDDATLDQIGDWLEERVIGEDFTAILVGPLYEPFPKPK